MTTYRVAVSTKDHNGVELSQYGAEYLGEAYGRTYATREAAEHAAYNLTLAPAEYEALGLDPSTRYFAAEN